ncbi:hypothetical protein OROMI_001310 [Orobanche minor]
MAVYAHYGSYEHDGRIHCHDERTYCHLRAQLYGASDESSWLHIGDDIYFCILYYVSNAGFVLEDAVFAHNSICHPSSPHIQLSYKRIKAPHCKTDIHNFSIIILVLPLPMVYLLQKFVELLYNANGIILCNSVTTSLNIASTKSTSPDHSSTKSTSLGSSPIRSTRRDR